MQISQVEIISCTISVTVKSVVLLFNPLLGRCACVTLILCQTRNLTLVDFIKTICICIHSAVMVDIGHSFRDCCLVTLLFYVCKSWQTLNAYFNHYGIVMALYQYINTLLYVQLFEANNTVTLFSGI